MITCRSVDNYLAYISEVIALVFRHRPETLRSGEQVDLEFILGHESMDDLTTALAERRVERLSYAGLSDLEGYLGDRLGLALFDSAEDRAATTQLVEKRSLIVHKRGVVDPRYRNRTGDRRADVGARLPLGNPLDGHELLARLACEMDERAALKWELPRPVRLSDLAELGFPAIDESLPGDIEVGGPHRNDT